MPKVTVDSELVEPVIQNSLLAEYSIDGIIIHITIVVKAHNNIRT
jgi:hypothetical protein